MIAKSMVDYVNGSSVIRAMFEEGNKMAKMYGAENVYDFSLGNPSVEPPKAVGEAMRYILQEEKPNLVHGYMNNAGYEDVRDAIANSINQKFDTSFNANNILMTVGAAGGLNVILKTFLDPEDEVVVFAPFFGEYANYIKNYGGVMKVAKTTEDFLPDPELTKEAITEKTKAVIINNPNNPTGVVYSEEDIIKLADVLRECEKEYGHAIYLIGDEPYRELVYDGVTVPYLTKYYEDTIVGYSYSKSLSLPGERIGYLVIPNEVDDYENVFQAAGIANRILGFVNAPSLLQRTVARCLDAEVDIDTYNKNRELLYTELTALGFECIKPQGAFYMFVKAPGGDDKEFVKKAKEFNLLLVPGSTFHGPGYVRIAYCVDYDMIKRALPAFEKLAKSYS